LRFLQRRRSALLDGVSGTRFTLIDDGTIMAVDAVVDGQAVRLAPAAVRDALGWELKPEGLCRGGLCVPVRDRAAITADGIDLAALSSALGRPLAIDVDERAAYLGTSASERGARLAALEAPDVELPDLAGRLYALRDFRGQKVLLVAYASW
jgi:hypothetical protein